MLFRSGISPGAISLLEQGKTLRVEVFVCFIVSGMDFLGTGLKVVLSREHELSGKLAEVALVTIEEK